MMCPHQVLGQSKVSDFAIGDLQGCFEPLQRLLDHINFDDQSDRLWFVGDLVNRGPDSLSVLRFIKALPIKPVITLGNHDLHLLASLFGDRPWRGADDTVEEILHAEDGEELGHWLRNQPLIYYSAELNYVMAHAGIPPIWDLEQALTYGQEVHLALAGTDYVDFLKHMYGNLPKAWSPQLQGIERLRLITNYLSRMRFCNSEGELNLSYKGTITKAPAQLYPWFEVPVRKTIEADILFGHWAALKGESPDPKIHALDTGCLWGGQLTALRLQDKEHFRVPGLSQQANR